MKKKLRKRWTTNKNNYIVGLVTNYKHGEERECMLLELSLKIK